MAELTIQIDVMDINSICDFVDVFTVTNSVEEIEFFIKNSSLYKDIAIECLEKIKKLYEQSKVMKIEYDNENTVYLLENVNMLINFVKHILLNKELTNENEKRFEDCLSFFNSKVTKLVRKTSYEPISPKGRRLIGDTDPRVGSETVSSTDPNKMTMKDLTSIIDTVYDDEESQHSTTLDILAIYLKGQKILYIEAKTYCEQHLHTLMLPAIFISSLCTLLSLVLKDYFYGPILVSSLMAVNSFILAMISYLKLDAKAEAHKITAYKFEKLQSICELKSGRTLFIKNDSGEHNLIDFINKLDEQVKEIKESNQFILPENVRYRYPILYSTNVFSDIKKLYNEELIQRNRLKNIINKIKEGNVHFEKDRDRLLERIIKCRDKYLHIDDVFNQEILEEIKHSKTKKMKCCNWLKA